MPFDEVLARGVALVGAAAIRWRRLQGTVRTPAVGSAPEIPAGRPQGRLPTLKMPTAQGWAAGQLPQAAAGLKANAFAAGLEHPRWILVLPNGDVTVAEALQSE
ncbi:MAG: sorbosone dehydrogenase family protein, partial [Burkholderiales bacterium]|nr:sorbosone dehydrogenase family protein [Burkholderiales bacterium]